MGLLDESESSNTHAYTSANPSTWWGPGRLGPIETLQHHRLCQGFICCLLYPLTSFDFYLYLLKLVDEREEEEHTGECAGPLWHCADICEYNTQIFRKPFELSQQIKQAKWNYEDRSNDGQGQTQTTRVKRGVLRRQLERDPSLDELIS